MCGKKGFTLVEILFVLIIMAGIAAYAVPAYKRSQERSQYERALGTLVSINNAINSLENDLAAEGSYYHFPGDVARVLGSLSNSNSNLPNGGDTPAEFMMRGDSRKQQDDIFWYLLADLKYLDRDVYADLDTTPYTFCAIYGKTSKTMGSCNEQCYKMNTYSSMCMYLKDTSNASGCFFGATIDKAGRIKRLVNSKCKTQTES